jgi:hypothetical protein
LRSRADEAIVWLEKARNEIEASSNTTGSTIRALLAAAYAFRGETELASTVLAEAQKPALDGRFSSIAQLRAFGAPWSGYGYLPKVRALFEATYFAGLRKAGMPEE